MIKVSIKRSSLFLKKYLETILSNSNPNSKEMEKGEESFLHREQARHGFVNGVRECLVAAESSPFSCHGGDTIVISGGRSPPSLFVDSLQRPSAANGLNEPDTGLTLAWG